MGRNVANVSKGDIRAASEGRLCWTSRNDGFLIAQAIELPVTHRGPTGEVMTAKPTFWFVVS